MLLTASGNEVSFTVLNLVKNPLVSDAICFRKTLQSTILQQAQNGLVGYIDFVIE